MSNSENKKHRERRVISNEEVKLPAEIANDEMLPAELDLLPLEKETTKVVNDIVKAKSVDELKAYTDMFSLNMAKKNAVRVAKLQNLLDKVNDQAIDRFEKHPDEFSNKEVLDYMKAVQEQITASQRTIEEIDNKPMIQVNNQKNEVNINVEGGLSRESKNKVLDAVNALLKQVQAPNVANAEEELYNNSEEDYSSEEDN